MECERLLGSVGSESHSTPESEQQPPPKQPRVHTAMLRAATEAYGKLLKTAYIVAIGGQPLRSFSSHVRAQKAVGVKLIHGTDSGDKAKEFVSYIATSIRQRVGNILQSCTAFSILSDGSQTRKTGSEKELVYVRATVGGKAVSYLAGCQNIDNYGDANAQNLKSAVDDVFLKTLKLDEDKYKFGAVSATADGAAVNFGQYSGLLTRMKESRPWMIAIHCINHRTELAVKDSLQTIKKFKDIEDIMTNLYYIFKRSGKLKRNFESMASLQEAQVYKFGKVHGTRFVSHHRRGVNVLMQNWLILLQTLENTIASKGSSSEAKLRGILKKLKNAEFLSSACVYREILDILSRLSLQFEREDLLIIDIVPALEEAKSRLQELQEKDPLALVESAGFTFEGSEVKRSVLKQGHMRRKVENREYTELRYSAGMTNVERVEAQASKLLSDAIPLTIGTLDKRFKSLCENEILQNTKWVNPANWHENPQEDWKSVSSFAEAFKSTLKENRFCPEKLSREWKDLQIAVKNYYVGVGPHILWQRLAQYRKMQFRNVLMLVEIALSFAGSNCVVESGFSVLTAMMSDRRLETKHDTLENLLLIKVNHRNWTAQQIDEILDDALQSYMSKRRKLKAGETGDEVSLFDLTKGQAGQDDALDIDESVLDIEGMCESNSESDSDINLIESDAVPELSCSENDMET